MASEMDFHNNEEGYQILKNNSEIHAKMNSSISTLQHEGINDLMNEICSRMEAGNMEVFSDPDGNNPDNDPNNYLIDSNECQCID